MLVFARRGETHYWGMLGAVTLAALFVGANWFQPLDPQLGERGRRIPLTIGDWRGTSSKVDEASIRVLKTKDIIMRQYDRASSRSTCGDLCDERQEGRAPAGAMLRRRRVRDRGEHGRLVRHRRGRAVAVRRLTIARSDSNQVVLYWYKAGDLNTPSVVLQNLYVVLTHLNPFAKSSTGVALIRVSATIANMDTATREKAVARLKAFARDAFGEIDAKLK